MLLKEFKETVGDIAYKTIIQMLKDIGPDARTQRISVVIAGILRFAVRNCAEHYDDAEALSNALIAVEEEPWRAEESSEEFDLLYTFIDELCLETGMLNERMSSKGYSYSIAEHAIIEYARWHAMPWED